MNLLVLFDLCFGPFDLESARCAAGAGPFFLNAMTDFSPPDPRLRHFPGHLFRRLHQIAVAKFTEEMDGFGLTPLQWAALDAIQRKPGVDQSALSRDIALDTSTVAGVIYRLEGRGLVERRASPSDRRLRILYLTEDGQRLLEQATPLVVDMQDWLLQPLSPAERPQFMAMMMKIVHRSAAD